MAELFGEKVLNVPIEDEVKKSYLDYSMSVIVGRALPDIRDGLKPVHRRILYAMNELNCTPDKPYKKSARIVGEVLGKYHPHGESSIYDALVRMAQPFSLRYPLVDGHGNFGSIDGDSPAAMRYTEARLSQISLELLSGLDRNTVDFTPNFDNTLKEPVVLPSKIPNLLINGSSGIAVGMATNIPPHNLKEVIDALIYMVDKEIIEGNEVPVEEILKLIKGPDFPTGGYVIENGGIKDYFETGRGSITIRGKWHIEEGKHKRKNFVITEIPFEVNKAVLVEKIAELAKAKKLRGVEDLRDESDRDGIRIVIRLSDDTNINVFENTLRKQTQFELNYGVILLGIKNNVPRVFTIPELLREFLSFREEVVIRETKFELERALKHLEILEGLKKAIEKIDSVVKLIRSSRDTQVALKGLIEMLTISETQAKSILEMRLSRLTTLENEKLEEDISSTERDIERYREILTKKEVLWREIKKDLIRIGQRFSDSRRTEIIKMETHIDIEDLIEDTEMIVSITNDGYIKRVSQDTFKIQRRGGKGVVGHAQNEEDYAKEIVATTNKSRLLFFTNKGKVYSMKVYEVPEIEREGKGTAIHRLLKLGEDENVSSVLALSSTSKIKHIVFITKKGYVKKSSIKDYENIKSAGKIAIKLIEGDELVSAVASKEKEEIIITTAKGQAMRFESAQIREMGRNSRGVIGIALYKEDSVVNGEVVKPEDIIMLITTNGFGKRLRVSEIRKTKRHSRGVRCIKLNEISGTLQTFKVVRDTGTLFIISKKGNLLKINIREIPILRRGARGVRVIKFKEEGDEVSSIAIADE